MPRPQFNLRALLAAMLVVGVATWGYIQARRSAQFTSIANDAKMKAEQLQATASFYFTGAEIGLFPWENGPHDAVEARRWAKDYLAAVPYYERLAAKYLNAAKRPWLSVAGDEPEPRWNH